MVDEQRQDVVVAQARGIRRIVPVCLEPSGPAIEPVQPSSPRTEPKESRAVLDHCINDFRGDACRIRRIVPVERVPPRFPVEPVQLRRADPENPLAVLQNREGIPSSRLFGFPGSFRYTVNGEGSLGKRFTPPPFVPTQITALAILQQGKRLVVVQTCRIDWIIAVPDENAAFTVKFEHAVGICGEP